MIPLFLAMSFFIRKKALEKTGLSSTGFGFGSTNKLNYYCMNCGNKHNHRECPKRGSRLKKAGW
jgi:hypothetical protein